MEMSTIQSLRQFINERLHTAAEDIFGCFEATVAKYEDELCRHRRLLDVTLEPVVKLQRTELPLQHCLNEEEIPSDQQLWNLERNPSLDQEEPEPPQIKEEEEHCIGLEVEQLVLKQEDQDNLLLNPTFKESDHSEPEPSDHQLLSHSSAQSQDLNGGQHGNSKSVSNAEQASEKGHHVITRAKVSTSPSNLACSTTMSKIVPNICKSEKVFQCDTCGKVFKLKSGLNGHLKVHTDEKPYLCKTCGKRFGYKSSLVTHVRVHTGENLYSCERCEKSFTTSTNLKIHERTHTGERPYTCITCGRSFALGNNLKAHERIHTGEKPFSCKTCGKKFARGCILKVHMSRHKELPQQHVCIKEEFPADLLERNPSSDQEEPEPPQIKEQQEEHCIELPEQHCLNEEKLPADQHLLNLERNPSLDQEEPEPPQIKEEEEHCIGLSPFETSFKFTRSRFLLGSAPNYTHS
ncbi:zinc finger protein 239 [Pleuronectes platessa]|uniref:zinc finger protein 239 n=1 Tax=Pleuronectes platessa TaxID=8262 RepID=UPI00232A561E|nr:zinc finger protein 239 [Pleuronectes platessa]